MKAVLNTAIILSIELL